MSEEWNKFTGLGQWRFGHSVQGDPVIVGCHFRCAGHDNRVRG
jgi:hypothetical protein